MMLGSVPNARVGKDHLPTDECGLAPAVVRRGSIWVYFLLQLWRMSDAEADAEADALLVDALQGAVCAAREPAEVLCSRENGAARMGLVRMDQPELLSSAIRCKQR